MYAEDKELQKVLANSDVENFSVEDKYHIIEAYMDRGGAAGLEIQMDDDEEDTNFDDMNEEDKLMIEA